MRLQVKYIIGNDKRVVPNMTGRLRFKKMYNVKIWLQVKSSVVKYNAEILYLGFVSVLNYSNIIS